LLTFYPRATVKVTGGKNGATALRRYVKASRPTALTVNNKKRQIKVCFATKWQRLTNTCARNVNTWAPPSILKIEINDNHCISTDVMYFATNKHLSTTAGSLNHDTKSLPFSQKAANIIYISQLNPINTHTHKLRPFTIHCSSLLPPHLRLPLQKWTISLLFQLKLFVCINSPPPPLTCATCFIMLMIQIFGIHKLCYYALFSIHDISRL